MIRRIQTLEATMAAIFLTGNASAYRRMPTRYPLAPCRVPLTSLFETRWLNAKAGDQVVLTGSLVVVLDGSALARAGEAAPASAGGGNLRAGREAATGGGGGIRGLTALGVRELTYRTCFVVCCVLPSNVAERLRRRGEESALENEVHTNKSLLFSMLVVVVVPYLLEVMIVMPVAVVVA